MSTRQSLGPVQITTLNVSEINLALRQLAEYVDEIKGLRGRAVVHDRMRADAPTANEDVAVVPVAAATATTAEDANTLDGVHAAEFALLAGRATGQTLKGGTAASENLTLQSTAHASRGKIVLPDTLQVNATAELNGTLDHNGTEIGFFSAAPVAQASAYTITNVTPDRAYDADAVLIAELADVVGTLIADLKLYGLLV